MRYYLLALCMLAATLPLSGMATADSSCPYGNEPEIDVACDPGNEQFCYVWVSYGEEYPIIGSHRCLPTYSDCSVNGFCETTWCLTHPQSFVEGPCDGAYTMAWETVEGLPPPTL